MPLSAVDTTKFNKFCRDLSRLTGVNFERVVKHEIAKTLEKAMKLTKVAKAQLIRKNHKDRQFITFNGKVYYLGNLYSDELWGAIIEFRKTRLQSRLRARGLSRQSWWLLSKAVGGEAAFDAPAFVQDALASSGREHPENIRVMQEGRGSRFSVTTINAQPTVQMIDGERALREAIKGRGKFFETNLKKKVFDKVASIAKKYPGFYTR